MENNSGVIGEKSVLEFLKMENLMPYQGRRVIIPIPGKDECFRKDDARIPILQKLYPDCVAMGAKEKPHSPMDGFAKILQRYGCDIIETDGKKIIWHEIKTDYGALQNYKISEKNHGGEAWQIAKEYIEVAEKRGSGNLPVELGEGAGWYYSYEAFMNKHDTLKNVPAKPDAHYLWYCLVVTEDINGNKQLLTIKTTMANLISVYETDKLNAKRAIKRGCYLLPMRELWWVDDDAKIRISDDEMEDLMEHAPGLRECIEQLNNAGIERKRSVKSGVKSDKGDAWLFPISQVVDE